MKIKMTRTKWIVSSILFLMIAYIILMINITTYEKLAKIEYQKGDYKDAIFFYNKALDKEVKNKKNLTKIAELNRGLSLVYLKKGELEKAKEYVKKALKIDLKLHGKNNINTVCDYFNLVSFDYAINKNNPDKIISDCLKILKKAKNIEKKDEEYYDLIARVYSNISKVYGDKKEYNKAIEYAKKALEINETKLKEKYYGILYLYNNIGSLYINNRNYDKGLYYFQKAFNIAKKYRININHTIMREIQKNIKTTNENLNYRNKMLTEIKKDLTKTIKITKNKEE
jgi:tetratricopeptide (TPR) repeat protein